MAKKKEGLYLFPEVEVMTADLTDGQMGALMRAVIAYRFHGKRYRGNDPMVKVLFNVLAGQIQRGLEVSRQKKEAAAVRWGKSGMDEKVAETAKPEQPDADGMQSNAEECTEAAQPMQTDAPIQTNPVQSNPVHSNPVQTKPFQNNVPAGEKEPHGEFGWVRLTRQAYDQLGRELGTAERDRCIAYVDTLCQSNGNKNGYQDWELLIRRCSREHWGLRKKEKSSPIYGSCTLGQAELDAIQRVLKQ